MVRKCCFFIGHRDAREEIYPELYASVRQHITEFGVTDFIVGHYGSFDRLAARAVKEAKKACPEVTLTLLLPYHPAERPMETPDGFDGTYYPDGMERVPRQVAIVKANQHMLNHTDYLIAYARHPGSNALNLVRLAIKRGVHVALIGQA